jgi:UDP-2,3-diacylglucosamine hydrolase
LFQSHLDLEWQRWVLSDWDLDHPEAYLPKASALRIDQHGVRYLDLVKN